MPLTTTRQNRTHQKRRPNRLAMLPVAALLLSACAGAAALEEPAPTAGDADFTTSDDIVGWNDDNRHVVVSTIDAPGNEPVETENEAEESDEPATGNSATDDSGGASGLTVVTPSGSQVLDRRPEYLVAVAPEGPVEDAALAAAELGSVIALDAIGEIGLPGGRYLRTPSTLTLIERAAEEPSDASTTEPLPGEEIFAELDDASTGAGIAVQNADGSSDAAIVAQISQLDGVDAVEHLGPGVIAVSIDAAASSDLVEDAIAGLDGVTGVNEDVLAYFSGDPRQPEQWAIENTGSSSQAAGWSGVAGADINAEDAWNVTTGRGMVIAVIDSGNDLDHRDLKDNYWLNPREVCGNSVDDDLNGFVDDCQGWDFGAGDNNPTSPPSSNGFHGTHVSGIIAAAANGVGVVGATPDARIMALKVAREDGAIPMSAVAAAINYAVDNDADVINLSLGTRPGSSLGTNSSTELAIRNARQRGVVVVVAAGNDSANLDQTGPGWPAGFSATYDNVLTVGASTNSDTHAYFSNTGSVVGLHAPGWAVLSTLPGNTEGMQYGTSMAAPYVAAGAAAVIASGVASAPAAVIQRLKASAADLGWGTRLDLAEAVGYRAPLAGGALDVTVSGADSMITETPSTLDWTVTAPEASTAVGMRMSVAARHDGVVSAVDGLQIDLSDASGPLSTVTSNNVGEFPIIPLRDLAGLVTSGASISATMSVPATEYAFVIELVDVSGASASDPYVTYVSVAPPAAPPPDSGNGGAPTTSAPSTTAPPAGSNPAPTTTAPPANPVPTTTPTSGSGGGSTPGTTVAPGPTPATTLPSSGGGGTAPGTTSPPAGGGPTPTTAPPGTGGATPSTTTPVAEPSPTTSTPASPPTVPTQPTTTTTVPVGGGTPPPTTTPPPASAVDGEFHADSMDPRSGSIDGNTRATITGAFPTSVPIYVWFGDQPTAVQMAQVTANELVFDTPAVNEAGVRDVVVRFDKGRPHELRLVNAFTYTDRPPPTTTPSTTVPSTGGSGGGTPTPATTTTTLPGSGPTAPTPTPTTSTIPSNGGGGGGGTVTTTTSPANTPPSSPATTTTTAPAPSERQVGSLTLRPQPSSGSLSRLSVSSWPASGCRTANCPGSKI